MPLWGITDANTSAPKFVVQSNTGGPNITGGGTGTQQYGNSVFMSNTATTLASHATPKGWIRKVYGRGPVTSITVTSGGTLYSNNDTVKVSGGSVNAVANIVTNGSGVITSVVLSNNGGGFSNSLSSTLAITTSTGSTAVLAPVFGGRAGRITYENLVAIASNI